MLEERHPQPNNGLERLDLVPEQVERSEVREIDGADQEENPRLLRVD